MEVELYILILVATVYETVLLISFSVAHSLFTFRKLLHFYSTTLLNFFIGYNGFRGLSRASCM